MPENITDNFCAIPNSINKREKKRKGKTAGITIVAQTISPFEKDFIYLFGLNKNRIIIRHIRATKIILFLKKVFFLALLLILVDIIFLFC
jgi:hypothetical protein